MARKTVRVKLPTGKLNDFSKLLNANVAHHKQLGKDSLLADDPDLDMDEFASKLAEADANLRKSEELRGLSEEALMKAKSIYGFAEGQNVQTPGTLYFKLDIVKRTLLKRCKGNEAALASYGFDVVIGHAKSPVRKTV